MTDVIPVLILGFFLGMRHSSDPDHVIAVSTIVARQQSARSAALIGALWGTGHTLTIMVVGGGIIVFDWVIPAKVGLSMELAVGVMLVLLGLMNLTGIRRSTMERQDGHAPHAHPHAHGDYIHNHPHGHNPEAHPHLPEETPVGWLDRHLGGLSLYQGLRPLLVGTVHGLAGSAAIALLVLTTIHDPRWGLVYLLIFGLGTILGMMLITILIALPFGYNKTRSSRFHAGLRLASGAVSLAFGLFLAYQIGIVQGLFGGGR